jgi:uncharacterized protein
VTLFVDTSAWYAAADLADVGNERAKRLLGAGEPLLTTDHVLVETWRLLRHRLGRRAAEHFWDRLRAGLAAVELVQAADLEAAWRIGQVFADQDFSLVDRTSFAVMERLRLFRVAAFDSDFAVYRYGRALDHAFTVLR